MSHLKGLLSIMMLFAVSAFLSPFAAAALNTTPLVAGAGIFTASIIAGQVVNLSPGMLAIDPVLTGLSTYAGTYASEIIGQVFNSLKDVEIDIDENVKGPKKYPKLSIGTGLRPYTSTFAGGDKLNYSDRALTPQPAKYELEIEPAKYDSSFMTETRDKHSKAYALPQENFIWMKVVEEMVDEFVMNTIYYGDTTSVTLSKKVADGFEKIIDAMSLTPIATGVITSSNAVSKMELMYKTVVEQNPAWGKKPLNLYCSIANGFNYIENYRSLFGYDPSIFSDSPKPMYLKLSNGLCKVTPVAWMGSSGRLIMSPKANLKMGTDKLSDQNVINCIPTVWTLQCGIRFTAGFQVIDDEAIWINDQD